MPFVAVTFTTEADGSERTQRVVVGRQWRGRRVLTIDGGVGGSAIVMEGGDIEMIPAGAILCFEPRPKPAPTKEPDAKRQQRGRPSALPPLPRGSVRSVRYHDFLGVRTVTVGDLFGSRLVVSISHGNRVVARLDDESTLELCGAGSVYTWDIA
jgi:hypothetical protein